MLGPNFVGFYLKAHRLYPTNMGFNPLYFLPRSILNTSSLSQASHLLYGKLTGNLRTLRWLYASIYAIPWRKSWCRGRRSPWLASEVAEKNPGYAADDMFVEEAEEPSLGASLLRTRKCWFLGTRFGSTKSVLMAFLLDLKLFATHSFLPIGGYRPYMKDYESTFDSYGKSQFTIKRSLP